jgi:hypothetical protein
MPCIEYKPCSFKPATLEMIEWANQLIVGYARQGLVLTLRQLYYQFVANDLIENSQKSYDRLGTVVNNARLAGLMDWDAIEDRGRNLNRNSHWENEADIVDTCARSFAIDKWEGQDYRVEVWVEKQALEAVVGQAAEPLDCAFFACKGYTSQSEMWRAAQRFEQYVDAGQRPVVIHLGDHDPSGVDMTRDISDRLNDLFGVEVIVERIALNTDQVRHYRPPPNPAKLTDSRAQEYIANYGHSSWELDALDPATLNGLIRSAIENFLDEDLFAEKVAAQEQMRKQLTAVSERWVDVEKFISELDKPAKKQQGKKQAKRNGKKKR